MSYSTKGNMYTSGQDEVRSLYADFIQGSDCNLLCAVSFQPLQEPARDALNGTAEALGYGADAFTFVCLNDGEIELDAVSLFTLLEGIDPLLAVFADEASRKLAETAYRCSLPSDAVCRLSGRDVVVFRDFSALLTSSEGKQKAWSLLKTLPKRS